MMVADFRWRDVLALIGKLVALMIAIGVPFWWFMAQLAEHGWK